jgi:F0F1-type ATP synthase membrane subunit b/b'
MGYNTGLEKSESEAETLRELLAANVRVIKEELRKEMQEELDNNNKED